MKKLPFHILLLASQCPEARDPVKQKKVLVGYNSWTIVMAKHGTKFCGKHLRKVNSKPPPNTEST